MNQFQKVIDSFIENDQVDIDETHCSSFEINWSTVKHEFNIQKSN